MTVELGDKVKDIVTGFTGIVVAKTQWLNGCWRISVQPQGLKDGKPIEHQAFDVEQLKILKAKEIKTTPPAKLKGGPRPDPVRQKTPNRGG